MFLASALNTCEDSVVCDLAEYYNIYDYQGVPVSLLASLVFGLSEDSRTKRHMSGMKISINTFLLASAVDSLNFLCWAQTKDAEKGKNKPKSILKILLGEEDKPKSEKQTFGSIEEFMAAWNKEV